MAWRMQRGRGSTNRTNGNERASACQETAPGDLTKNDCAALDFCRLLRAEHTVITPPRNPASDYPQARWPRTFVTSFCHSLKMQHTPAKRYRLQRPEPWTRFPSLHFTNAPRRRPQFVEHGVQQRHQRLGMGTRCGQLLTPLAHFRKLGGRQRVDISKRARDIGLY